MRSNYSTRICCPIRCGKDPSLCDDLDPQVALLLPSGILHHVNDDCWESTEASFKEAFFAHPALAESTTIASLDVAADKQNSKGMSWWAAR